MGTGIHLSFLFTQITSNIKCLKKEYLKYWCIKVIYHIWKITNLKHIFWKF